MNIAGFLAKARKLIDRGNPPPPTIVTDPQLISAVDHHNQAFKAQMGINKSIQNQWKMSSFSQQLMSSQNTLNQQSGQLGMIGSASIQASPAQIATGFPTGFLAGNPTTDPWEAWLAGRTPTAELGLLFLKGSPDGFWAEPLTLVLSECLDRIKELEDTNPWQKSYDQIADEKEARANGIE